GEAATGLGDELLTSRGAYPFDHLVLATGALPVALPGDGRQRFLRTYDDALALRELLRPGLRLAIVGAGWIGAELATAAVAHGTRVTVVGAGPAPLAAAIGAPVGAQTARWYAEAGVDLRVATAVEAVRPGGLALAGGGHVEGGEDDPPGGGGAARGAGPGRRRPGRGGRDRHRGRGAAGHRLAGGLRRPAGERRGRR